MKAHRATAAAIALFGAALAVAGCGFGAGPSVGEVELRATRDFGSEHVTGVVVDDVAESDTVMRVLDRNAEIETRYGGGFVQSIDGVSGATQGGQRYDWFFYVNGVESSVGAADYSLRGNEAIWWDYRDWSAAARVPAVVGSWPHPFVDGYDGEEHPVSVKCLGGGAACALVRGRLEAVGASPATGSPDDAIEVLVGPWARVRSAPPAAQVEAGPQMSGVFGDFHRHGGQFGLVGLDEAGEEARRFGPDAGLVAATRRYDGPPVWMITGSDARGVRAAAGLLDSAELRDHYAVAVEGEETTPLPVR